MAKDEDRKKKKRKIVTEPEIVTVLEEVHVEEETATPPEFESKSPSVEPTEASSEEFEAWYLRKVTIELQDDLNKVRSAGDFKDSSLPILITALKQGESVFSKEEKTRILGGGA